MTHQDRRGLHKKQRGSALSEEMYRTVLANISDTVLITDSAGEFKFICPNIHTIFGFTDQEVQDLGNITHLLGNGLLEQYAMSGVEELTNVEIQAKDKRGERHILLVNIKAVPIFGGTILFTCRDITERKRAETRLYWESVKAQQYLDIVEVLIMALNEDGEITLINQKGCTVLGYNEGELIGKNWFQMCVPVERHAAGLAVFRSWWSDPSKHSEFHENDVITKSGEKRRFAWRSSVLHNDSGRIIGVLASGEDITERKKAEEAARVQTEEIRAQAYRIKAINQLLQQQLDENIRAKKTFAENEAALTSLINNVDEGIFACDREIRLTSFNTIFQKRIEHRYDVVIYKGMAILDYLPARVTDTWRPLVERALRGETFDQPMHIVIPERKVDVYNEVSFNPIHSASGEVIGVAMWVRDVTKSKQADAALRESEERFRRVVENVPLAFHIYDVEHDKFLYTNPIAERTFQQVTGRALPDSVEWLKYVHPDDLPSLLTTLNSREKIIKGELEYRVLYPSGDMRYMRQITFPIVETDARILQFASFTEDVTERKRVEQALKQNERLLASVIHHSLTGIALLGAIRDAQGNIVDFEFRLANLNLAQRLNHTPTSLIGQRLSNEVPPDSFGDLFGFYARVVETGEVFNAEYLNEYLPTPTYFHLTGVKLDDGLVITSSNITEQKLNQNALMQNRALLESILTNLPTGVVVTSLDGQFLSVNERYARLLKHRPEELLDHNAREVMTDEELEIWTRNAAHVLKTGVNSQSELHEVIDGTLHTLLVNRFPLRDDRGQTFAIGRIAVDITDQQKIQDQLRDLSKQIVEVQEKERRHIARELHDEVGQSLTGVLLLLNKLERTSLDSQNVTISQIQGVIRQLMAQIRELSHNLHPPILDNHGLLGALRWYCNHYSTQTQIQVTFKYTGLQRRLLPEIELTCYRVIQEALTNIARYAQVDAASVNVSVSQKRVKLVITDRGVGFDVELVRAKNATFGLAGMSERVSLLRGNLTLLSVPNKGTSITVEIPLTGVGQQVNPMATSHTVANA